MGTPSPKAVRYPACIQQLAVREDNYIYFVIRENSNEAAVIDPADAGPVLAFAEARGLKIVEIWNTHHHGDHVGGNRELVATTGAYVRGPLRERIPSIDQRLSDGDTFTFGAREVEVLDIPGHTIGHIGFYVPSIPVLFCGDTLFSMGCGRLFEGTPTMMWESLSKIRALPDDTWICCAHEYTLTNGTFALTVDQENIDLRARVAEVRSLRRENKPTVPCLLGVEKRTNPFLRADTRSLASQLAMPDADPVRVFAEVRQRRNGFRA